MLNSCLLGRFRGSPIGDRPDRSTIPELRSWLNFIARIVIYFEAKHSARFRLRCRLSAHIDQWTIIMINVAMQNHIPFSGSLHHALHVLSCIAQTLLTLPPLFRITCVTYCCVMDQVLPALAMFTNTGCPLNDRPCSHNRRDRVKQLTIILVLVW